MRLSFAAEHMDVDIISSFMRRKICMNFDPKLLLHRLIGPRIGGVLKDPFYESRE